MNKSLKQLASMSMLAGLLGASAAQAQVWPQAESAYQQNRQQSPQWIENKAAPQPNVPQYRQAAPMMAPQQQVPQMAYPQVNRNYSQQYYYSPYARPYGPYNYYQPRRNNWGGGMPFFGNNRSGGWPNGNWGNWNMPDMDMSMPDMNMPDMNNMPFSDMPSPSFDMPSPSFTVPNMPMPFWN